MYFFSESNELLTAFTQVLSIIFVRTFPLSQHTRQHNSKFFKLCASAFRWSNNTLKTN